MRDFGEFLEQVEELLMKLFHAYTALDRQKVYYIENLALNPSDAQAIDAIAADSSLKMRELANVLGISKGAMSKLAHKLEERGLIRLIHYVDNRKDMYCQLTDLGWAVYVGYKAYHQGWRAYMQAVLSPVSDDEAHIILKFLNEYYLEIQASVEKNQGEKI